MNSPSRCQILWANFFSVRLSQVYQIVRKIVDDQSEQDKIRLSVPVIYETIKKSNSNLNRKPKRILEDSIERVVEVIKTDVLGEDDNDSVEGDFEGLEEEKPVLVCQL